MNSINVPILTALPAESTEKVPVLACQSINDAKSTYGYCQLIPKYELYSRSRFYSFPVVDVKMLGILPGQTPSRMVNFF